MPVNQELQTARWARSRVTRKRNWKTITVEIDYDDHQTMKVLADKQGVPFVEVLRTFITWGLEQEENG